MAASEQAVQPAEFPILAAYCRWQPDGSGRALSILTRSWSTSARRGPALRLIRDRLRLHHAQTYSSPFIFYPCSAYRTGSVRGMDENAFAGGGSRREFKSCLDFAAQGIRGRCRLPRRQGRQILFSNGEPLLVVLQIAGLSDGTSSHVCTRKRGTYVVTLKNMPGGGGPSCPRKDESDQQ